MIFFTFAQTWKYVFGMPSGKWMISIPDNSVDFSFDVFGNLDEVHPGKVNDECVIYNTFESEQNGEAFIGASFDWWFEAYLNGEQVYTTFPDGNLGTWSDPDMHIFRVHLKKGSNLLAIRAKRGMGSWRFSCRPSNHGPLECKVKLGPWLTNPDTGKMTIRFLTGEMTGAGVEYRRKGTEQWLRKMHAHYGKVIRGSNHAVNLTGLVPGEEYEYRIVLLRPTEQRPWEIIEPEVRTFRAPDDKKEKFSFLFTADLQFPLEQQNEMLQAMFEGGDEKSCDFIVLGGDMKEFHDIHTDLLYACFQSVIRYGCDQKPVIYVRGNHEMRGKEADQFLEYFSLPDGRPYGIFRYGATAFLILDCWEDKPASSDTNYTRFNMDAEALREEREFLEDALTKDCWTGAKRRIVLAHGTVYSNYDGCNWQPLRLQEMTDDFFEGKNPKYKLDMWLCGHSHVYLRSYPGTDILAGLVQPPAPFKTGETYSFPVLTVGGPNRHQPENLQATAFRVDVEADKITVKSIDRYGKIFDCTEFFNDGGIVEQIPIPHFHCPPQKPENMWIWE